MLTHKFWILKQVEDHEVECDPKFRLFLHTTVEPHDVPQTLAAYCTVMYFQQSRHCLEVELMERFKAKKEKSRSEEERQALRVVSILQCSALRVVSILQCSQILELFVFPIFWHWASLMKVSTETLHAH